MKHIILSSNYASAPKLIRNEDQTPSHVNQDVTINVGIEGAPEVNISTGTTIRLELPDTILQAIQKVEAGIVAFVSEKYPD